jgi:hypothetical protein
LTENKISKYLLYAIGEIVLVVFGILIALQINNWNESRKLNSLVKNYEQNIIEELKSDLLRLNEMDSLRNVIQKRADNYLDYYNSENPDVNTLIAKFDSIRPKFDVFTTSTFTVQDLVTTGNLKLFPSVKKNAILKFKYDQDRYMFYEQRTLESVVLAFEEFQKYVDLLFENNFVKKEHAKVKNWRYDLNSDQFRLQHNGLAKLLGLYNYQNGVYKGFRERTLELLKLLEENYASTPMHN